jgi:hypothetical protein
LVETGAQYLETDTGNFFFPSPAANPAGYGRRRTLKSFAAFRRDIRVCFAPFIFQHPMREIVSSQKSKSSAARVCKAELLFSGREFNSLF